MFILDEDTDPKLRNQILLYHMSDILTDRERARLLGLPEGCRIRERAKILAPEKLLCGRNVWIGEGAVLDAQGGLTIGDYTQIGLNVMIWSHTSHRQALSSQTGISRENIIYKSTKIGSNCFIGGPSLIAPGVTIGDKVIISPLTFVDRDIPDDKVVGSNREIRHLQSRVQDLEEIITNLLRVLTSTEGLSVIGPELREVLSHLSPKQL